MANHGKVEKITHPKASVSLEGRTVRRRRPSQGQSMSSSASNSTVRRERAANANASKRAAQSSGNAKRASHRGTAGSVFSTGAVSSIANAFASSRTLTIIGAIVVVLILGLVLDTAINFGRACGNVYIGNVEVSGLNAEDMRSRLEETYGQQISQSSITVYANEKARDKGETDLERQERSAQAEQIAADEAASNATSWTTTGAMLKATIPYDGLIEEALHAGKSGGPFGRLAVMMGGEHIPVSVEYDQQALDDFAGTIDKAVGKERVDTTVAIEDGKAKPVEGHEGNIVDRNWLTDEISKAVLAGENEVSIIAQTIDAPSRTSLEQAQELSDGLNKALSAGAAFTYQTNNWTADGIEIGNWTKVNIVERDGNAALEATIDASTATSALVKNVSITPTKANSSDLVVSFEKTSDGIVVHSSGGAEIPDVVSACNQLQEKLYGAEGIAWSANASPSAPKIEIAESSAPESLTVDQAVQLGIITVIGEYTTEFSNEEGTENRNHNIKLVCDLINDSITTANGGRWSFNEHTGDTNMDPPFASAGSIVNGEYVDSIGGGICQVATTVFNAVFEAGIKVVDRRNHSLYIASYPTGRDVGVSYPELDFVWEDNLTSDILMKTSYTDTSVTVKLYSVYTGYTVESTEGEWEDGEKYATTYEEDDSLEKGESYVKTTGEDGHRIVVTRIVKNASGEVISEDEFESQYEPKNEVYAVGPGTDTSSLGSYSSDDEHDEEKSDDEEGSSESGETPDSDDQSDNSDETEDGSESEESE